MSDVKRIFMYPVEDWSAAEGVIVPLKFPIDAELVQLADVHVYTRTKS